MFPPPFCLVPPQAKRCPDQSPVVIGKVPKQRAAGPYHTNEKARSHTRPLAFSYFIVPCPAGHHSDAIPTGTSFQASTRPPAGNCMERNQPLTPPCTQPSGTTRAPPVAGHPFPRPSSKPPSELVLLTSSHLRLYLNHQHHRRSLSSQHMLP